MILASANLKVWVNYASNTVMKGNRTQCTVVKTSASFSDSLQCWHPGVTEFVVLMWQMQNQLSYLID